MIHIATVLALIEKGLLKYNIKFMIEGDEETGSPYLEKFVRDHQDLLACDTIVVSDGEIFGDHTPTIGASFRGGCNMTLTLRTADVDLHSGLRGGIAPNSAYEATKLLSKLYNEHHEITIPGYYNTVAQITEAMLENNRSLPFDEEDLKKMSGIKALLVQRGYDPATANGLMPTIQISGMQSGYTGVGYRNAIPHKTMIKMNFRFAPGQDPDEMIGIFKNRVTGELPEYVTSTIEISDPYAPIMLITDHPEVARAAKILSEVYSKEAVYRYVGAAIPVVGVFQSLLQIPVIIADLGNEDCNMHGVGENFRLSCIEKGLEFSRLFFSN